MRSLITTIACLAALAVGATGVAAAPTTPRTAPAYDFTLLYGRSGGFAPSTRGLTVAPGQFATAEVSRTTGGKRHRGFHLSTRRIRVLERLLRRAHFGSLKNPGPSGCADCFEYELFYDDNYLQFDQSQTPPRLEPVIAEIEAIISAHVGREDA